ncbi:MAG: BON domain-containing protein [Maricaulis sp.]|jgi:osmotically-inducible protein OsmY|nr:BON domain-containing protein [Maricaulis sp.]MDG2042975.1 BON domain-containing protein [Maricaulis sp.]
MSKFNNPASVGAHGSIRVFATMVLLLALAGCSTMQEERSIGRELDDVNASLAIKSAMIRNEGYALGGVDVEVTEGIALLTGTVPREDDSLMAECLAWSSVAVRAVANELLVGTSASIRNRTNDAWITQNVRGRLLTDRSIRSVNFNVETYAGKVYLLGLARTRGELERASTHASLVDGVGEVISYVRVVGTTSTLPSRGERRAAACGGEATPALDPGDLAPN